MKILIVSQVFWPENFRINDLTTELIRRGHIVTVITGKPNYPKGKFYKGFGILSKIKNNYNGATVYRLPIIPRGNSSGLMLSLNYLSFAVIGSFFLLLYRKKNDFSFVYAVSPLTSALPAIVYKTIFNTKVILWVQDLWPEGVLVTGKLRSRFLKKCLYLLVKFIYDRSDDIYISSRYMEKSILEKLSESKNIKIRYLPNWAEDNFETAKIDTNKYLSLIPSGFKIMFAGNLGSGQDIPAIINAALELKKYGYIKFIVLGDGSERNYLLKKITELDLFDTIFYLGSYPFEEMPNFYYHADMMLLTLRDEFIYSFTVPGKLQSYLASRKPVAAMINGEAADIIKRSGCGIVVNAGDYKKFAKEILNISQMKSSFFYEMGQNGYKYYENTFKKVTVIDSFIKSVN